MVFCFATKEEKMTHVFKQSLMMAALVAAFAAAQAGNATAQSVQDISANPTALFAGEIPQTLPPGRATAFYDPANGEVTLVVGSEAIFLGLFGEQIINDNFTGLNDALGPIATSQNDEGGIGFFNTAGIIRSFDGGVFASGVAGAAPFNLGAILPAGLETPAEFNAAFGQTDDAASVFFAVGFQGTDNGGTGFPSVNFGFQILSSATGPGPIVPEPSSLSLLALAGLGLVARRRR